MTPAHETTRLILDVDTGVDDCVALLYALAAPQVELLAVTCVAGNVAEPQVEANTLAVFLVATRSRLARMEEIT